MIPSYKPILEKLYKEAGKNIHTRDELSKILNNLSFEKLWGTSATPKTIDNILQKKFYYGIMEAKSWKQEALGTHETVIDETTWTKAYTSIYKKHNRGIKLGKSNNFSLKGFVHCGGCGRPLRGSYNRGNGGLYANYHCTALGCLNRVIERKEKLEESFKEFLKMFELSEIQKKLLRVVLLDKLESKVRNQEKEEECIRKNLEEIKGERMAILKSNSKGLIGDEEASPLLEKLKLDEMTFNLEISESKIDKHEAEAVINFTAVFLTNVGKFWERLDSDRKIRLQEAIFPKGVIFKDGNFGTKEISPSFNLIQQFAEDKTSLVRCYNEVRTYFQAL